MQKDKESNNSLFPILFLTFHEFIPLEVLRHQLIFFLSFSFLFRIKRNNYCLDPSGRPIIVKICAIFSIKITFVNGHGETSSSSVLKRSKTNKRNRNDQDKTNKNKNKNNQNKTKQKNKHKTENCECMFNVTWEQAC